jgi:hypothetical protein
MKNYGLVKQGLEDASCIVGNRSLRREVVEAHPHSNNSAGGLPVSGQRPPKKQKKRQEI